MRDAGTRAHNSDEMGGAEWQGPGAKHGTRGLWADVACHASFALVVVVIVSGLEREHDRRVGRVSLPPTRANDDKSGRRRVIGVKS